MTVAHVTRCLFLPRAPYSLLVSASILFVGLAASTARAGSETGGDEYQFDDNMMFGGGSLSRFNKVNAIDPGNYTVDLYINNRFVERTPVQFVEVAKGDVQPCLPPALLEGAGVLNSAISDTPDQECQLLSNTEPGLSLIHI